MLLRFNVCRLFTKGGLSLSSACAKFHSVQICNQIYKRKFIYIYITRSKIDGRRCIKAWLLSTG